MSGRVWGVRGVDGRAHLMKVHTISTFYGRELTCWDIRHSCSTGMFSDRSNESAVCNKQHKPSTKHNINSINITTLQQATQQASDPEPPLTLPTLKPHDIGQ